MEAQDCPLRHYVDAHPYGTSRSGYGCLCTGGHCELNDKCDERVKKSQNKPVIRWESDDR